MSSQPSTDDPVFLSLKEAQEQIRDSDLLLFRRHGLIAIAGRGVHSHAAKAVWLRGKLFCAEVREFYGGRLVTLDSQVRKYPRRIDVFEADSDGSDYWYHGPGFRHVKGYDRSGAADFIIGLAGSPYGYWHIVLAACLHMPVLRIFCRPQLRDTDLNGKPPFCSEAVAMADRIGGGVDPVPNLADRLTEPADLARSTFYRYRFTLEP
jgi:hypothetical protein